MIFFGKQVSDKGGSMDLSAECLSCDKEFKLKSNPICNVSQGNIDVCPQCGMPTTWLMEKMGASKSKIVRLITEN